MIERYVTAGLWSIPGVGPMAIAQARATFGQLETLAGRPPAEWAHVLADHVRERLPADFRLEVVGEAMLARAKRLGISVAFQDDPAYPPRLLEISDAPPLLFHIGPGAAVAPRRRLGAVGTRNPDTPFWPMANALLQPVSHAGMGIVSGAARGIDTWCHTIAADAGGETWAFLGSAIDQLDASPRRLWDRIRSSGATFFSEYPLGVRGATENYPRRNRLISGSSDALLVLRAKPGSGTRHTVDYAIEQKRPVLAIVSDSNNINAAFCNQLVKKRQAELCETSADILHWLGASVQQGHQTAAHTASALTLDGLSPVAKRVLEHVSKASSTFDDVLFASQLTSGEVGSALFELEAAGYILRYGGSRLQRV